MGCLQCPGLAGGFYQNLAESDEELTVTGGLGLNLWLLRLDLAGALGLDTVEYDGDEYPTDAHFSFGLQADF